MRLEEPVTYSSPVIVTTSRISASRAIVCSGTVTWMRYVTVSPITTVLLPSIDLATDRLSSDTVSLAESEYSLRGVVPGTCVHQVTSAVLVSLQARAHDVAVDGGRVIYRDHAVRVRVRRYRRVDERRALVVEVDRRARRSPRSRRRCSRCPARACRRPG